MTSAFSVPRFQVDLDVPAKQRWSHIIDQYRELLRGVEANLDDTIKAFAPKMGGAATSITEWCAGVGSRWVLYKDELEGIAERCGISLGRLVLMQLVYEASARCTSVISATADGTPVHSRTMDWEMDFLKPLTIEVDFVKGGALLSTVVTWVGFTGVFTGIGGLGPLGSPFSCSVNYRSVGTGTFWTNLKLALSSHWPIGFLLREVLCDQDIGYAQAVAYLENSELIAPCYFTVCGTAPNEGVIITRDRQKSLQRWDLGINGDVVQPNMDHWSSDPEESIMYSIQRRQAARRGLTSTPPSARTVEWFWTLMNTSPILNDITVYGTVMQPSKRFIETRLPIPRYGFRLAPASEITKAQNEGKATCSACSRTFNTALNPAGECTHIGQWHARYEDCSYIKCGLGLGVSRIGKQHWSCCFSTDASSTKCTKSGPHY
eukprot:PhF_6_TR5610/c0_g1_i1/m.8102